MRVQRSFNEFLDFRNLKIRNKFSRKGLITFFIGIILTAVILIQTTLYLAARTRALEADLSRFMQLQLSYSLSRYDRSFLNYYRLYGLTGLTTGDVVLKECFSHYNQIQVQLDLSSPITNENLRAGITDFMKLRVPAIGVSGLLERIKRLNNSAENSKAKASLSQVGASEWLPEFKSFLSQKSAWEETIIKALETAENVDVTGKVSEVKQFLLVLRENLERLSTLSFQGEELTSSYSDFLDPSSIEHFTQYLDSYLNFDLPAIADSLLINEYAVDFFDSYLTEEEKYGHKTTEKNLLQIPFTEMHQSNQTDLEYILTGIDREETSVAFIKFLLVSVRSSINFASYLTDNEKKNQAMAIATILSLVVGLISMGNLMIEPDKLQYLVLFVWAIAQGYTDMNKLVAGDKIPLIEHSSISENIEGALLTGYKDYFRLFLLVIPEEKKIERINRVFERDIGVIYTGVALEVNYKQRKYFLEDSYICYENEG